MLCLNAKKKSVTEKTSANHIVTVGEKFSSPPLACGSGFRVIHQEKELF